MGKQIQFFMNEQDEREFVKFIYSKNDFLILIEVDKNGKVQMIKESEELRYPKYCIFSSGMKISVENSGFIEEFASEMIEFKRTEKRDNIMYPGRLWMEMKYWDENNNLCSKNPELDKKYKIYKRYITKNFRISEDKFFYIGPRAYEWYKSGGKTMAGPILEAKF